MQTSGVLWGRIAHSFTICKDREKAKRPRTRNGIQDPLTVHPLKAGQMFERRKFNTAFFR
jgi:hypothetical protein